MKTTRFVLATVLTLLIAIPVTAQEKQEKRKGPAVKISTVSQAMMRMQKLHDAVEGLDLTAQQEEQLGKLREKNGPKMKELLEKLGDIVTEEQKTAAKEAAEKAKEAKKEGRQFFVAVEAAVKLTDEQAKKMDVIGKEMVAMHRGAMKDVLKVLTEEQAEKVKKAMMPAPKKEGAKGGKKKAE